MGISCEGIFVTEIFTTLIRFFFFLRNRNRDKINTKAIKNIACRNTFFGRNYSRVVSHGNFFLWKKLFQEIYHANKQFFPESSPVFF